MTEKMNEWIEYDISAELEKDNVEYEKKNKKNIKIEVMPEPMSKGELYSAFAYLRRQQLGEKWQDKIKEVE